MTLNQNINSKTVESKLKYGSLSKIILGKTTENLEFKVEVKNTTK